MTTRRYPPFLLALLLLLALGTRRVRAQDRVPYDFQALLIKKLYDYNGQLKGKDPAILLLEGSEGEGKDLAAAMTKVGLKVTLAPLLTPYPALDKAIVVYTPDITPAIKLHCETRKVLSIATQAKFVEAGQASIAFRMRANRRPEIVIHLERSKAEGQSLSSDLLKLVTVIR